jgi:tryptophan synthase beta chain
MSTFDVDAKGFYGKFGGAFIPEMLYANVSELQNHYRRIVDDAEFQKEFRDLLRHYVGRPTPLYLARRLSEYYKATIFLKREDLCHTGAHKINNTIGQVLVARRLNKKRIIAETGAGQHGVATATVCALLGLSCTVYMGARDIDRQRLNVERMRFLGAEVRPVTTGSQTLKDAVNEALREWIRHPSETHYVIGSVVGPHPYPDMVARFQSVISQEIRVQLTEQIGRPLPDAVIACVGGGSNAAGAFYHFLDDNVRLIGVEAAGEGIATGKSAATVALGKPGILHGCRTMVMQNDDGQILEAHSISAGLDYPGIGPLHACLNDCGRVAFLSATDAEAIEAGRRLARLEGIIPALESAHALAGLEKLPDLKDLVVVANLSGRGDKDISTYSAYENGVL